MKLNNESNNLINILNTYLTEINDEILITKDKLDENVQKKNVLVELKNKTASDNLRYNAFAPRKNEVEEDDEELIEVNKNIEKYQEKVNNLSNKVASIKKSIEDFITSFESLKADTEEKIDDNSDNISDAAPDNISRETDTTSKKEDDTFTNINVSMLIDDLKNIDSNLNKISVSSAYDYRNTQSSIKKISLEINDIIDNLI